MIEIYPQTRAVVVTVWILRGPLNSADPLHAGMSELREAIGLAGRFGVYERLYPRHPPPLATVSATLVWGQVVVILLKDVQYPPPLGPSQTILCEKISQKSSRQLAKRTASGGRHTQKDARVIPQRSSPPCCQSCPVFILRFSSA